MSGRPDVCFVSLYPPHGRRHAGRSGVASYTANLAHALSRRGARVAVVAEDDGNGPARYTDGPVRVERRFRRGARALSTAARAVRELGPEVVHLQFELFLYGGPSAVVSLAPALRSLGRPVVTMHQVVDPEAVNAGFIRRHRMRAPAAVARMGARALQGGVPRLAARTIVHEPAFARAVPGAHVVPHGVEELVSPDPHEARRRLDLDDRPTVLCFGFLAPYKGLEAALAAAELAGDAFRLVVAGGEHPRIAGREDYGEALRARWGRAARFTGFVPESELPWWFAAVDLALLPYPEPFSSSGALALALGYRIPVLLSEPLAGCIDAPPELAVSTAPAELARTLATILDDPSRLEAVRRASAQLRRDRTWDDVAERHLAVYEEVSR